jgi:phosphoenolpyruvate-protein kinase (PTS system EI component)
MNFDPEAMKRLAHAVNRLGKSFSELIESMPDVLIERIIENIQSHTAILRDKHNFVAISEAVELRLDELRFQSQWASREEMMVIINELAAIDNDISTLLSRAG